MVQATGVISDNPEDFRKYYDDLLMFVSFILTVVPFFHGSLRYLDQRYIINEDQSRRCSLMIDFVALFVQALLLFALATVIGQLRIFYSGLVGLLIFDILWVGVTGLTKNADTNTAKKNAGEKKKHDEHSFRRWAGINAITIWAILLSVWSTLWADGIVKNTILVLIAGYRTVLDYLLVWDWYYPPEIPVPPPARPINTMEQPNRP